MSEPGSRETPGRPAGIEIVPLGGAPRPLIERIARVVGGMLGSDVSVAPAQPLPEAAYQSSRGQYNASMILDALRPVVWKRGWKRVGIIDADIFATGLNFVFGQADLSGSTAVVSLRRLGNEFYGLPGDENLLVERAAKEIIHEVGHTLGLVHCKSRTCVMYFSNSLTETDRKGMMFCPQCRSRVRGGKR